MGSLTGEPQPYRPSVSMLGWGLNEQDNVRSYVERAETLLRSISDDFELILIDDGSSDRTWEIMSELQRSRPWLRPLRNDGNKGVGYSYRRAIKAATKEYFFAQTVDWAYDIDRLAASLHLLREFDVLQGVRPPMSFRRALSSRSDSAVKAVVSIVNYRLIRTLFRLPLSDYQNVTVTPTRLVQPLDLEANSSFANPEVLLNVWWQGASFKEVPVPFRRRTRGVAKGTRPRALVASVRDIASCWFRWIVLGRRAHRGRGRVSHVDAG